MCPTFTVGTNTAAQMAARRYKYFQVVKKQRWNMFYMVSTKNYKSYTAFDDGLDSTASDTT